MIDFHCHLDLYPEPQAVVRECASRGLYALAVTTTPSAWQGTSELVSGADRIRVALGLHPELARERRSELPLFEQLLPRTRYVGEIGLDGSPEMRRFWADQKHVFDRILANCQVAGGKIMTIHSRRAVTEVLDSLESHPGAGVPILHWYSGGSRELARAIALGCWFSVGPAMLHGEKGRKLAARMPRDRVLTETDGPFAMVDGRAAFPWDVDLALGTLGALWGVDKTSVQTTINDNFRRLIQS
ncbi:hydrolase TatD [Bradyrhizobium liaoningense]|nr:hydrolase TatD [Bradyrhizobium liaoningense]